MRLPNADKLVVEREKIVDYLLNPAHPDNGGKAAFVLASGFKREQCNHRRQETHFFGKSGFWEEH